MHEVSRILGFFHCKYNEMHSIAKIPVSTRHVHLNPKIHEVEMICAHAQWLKHYAFGQSRISLDTGTTYIHASHK